jgi:hypothetical protein
MQQPSLVLNNMKLRAAEIHVYKFGLCPGGPICTLPHCLGGYEVISKCLSLSLSLAASLSLSLAASLSRVAK